MPFKLQVVNIVAALAFAANVMATPGLPGAIKVRQGGPYSSTAGYVSPGDTVAGACGSTDVCSP